MMQMKTCSKCKTHWPESMFGRQSSAKDGLQGRCRFCVDRQHRSKDIPAKAPVPRRRTSTFDTMGEWLRLIERNINDPERIGEIIAEARKKHRIT